MRILFPTGIRTFPIDRNPIGREYDYNTASVAPHAATQRGQYTVPANANAILNHLFLQVFRQTAAAPVGEVKIWAMINYGPGNIMLCNIRSVSNVVDALVSLVFPPGVVLPSGSILTYFTSDASTGGTNWFTMSMSFLEYYK